MRYAALVLGIVLSTASWSGGGAASAEEDQLAYAVVSETPRDKTRVSVKLAIDGTVADMKLVASEAIVNNLFWRKIEVCHALKLEGQRSGDEFRITSVRAIDGSMLPMALQGFAGDCLLKKALEVAPLVD